MSRAFKRPAKVGRIPQTKSFQSEDTNTASV